MCDGAANGNGRRRCWVLTRASDARCCTRTGRATRCNNTGMKSSHSPSCASRKVGRSKNCGTNRKNCIRVPYRFGLIFWGRGRVAERLWRRGAWELCGISPLRFQAECCKRWQIESRFSCLGSLHCIKLCRLSWTTFASLTVVSRSPPWSTGRCLDALLATWLTTASSSPTLTQDDCTWLRPILFSSVRRTIEPRV